MTIEDVTPDIQEEADKVDVESKEASKKLSSRRPNLNFIEMGIPVGSVLQFSESNSTVTVISERKVSLNNDELSLTRATRELLGLEYSVQPSPYWRFEGRTLKDIYEETYSLED